MYFPTITSDYGIEVNSRIVLLEILLCSSVWHNCFSLHNNSSKQHNHYQPEYLFTYYVLFVRACSDEAILVGFYALALIIGASR